MNKIFIKKLLLDFLREDVGEGDVTTELIWKGEKGKGVIEAKEEGVLAGTPFVEELLTLFPEANINFLKKEGELFKPGDIIGELDGRLDTILTLERTCLNILQKLSGIATRVNKLVKAVEDKGIKILDTRKTTPGWRYLEKYAVKVGGGFNHRFNLHELILIKDNHKKMAGGLRKALRRVKENRDPYLKVEVEVENFDEIREALEEGADIIMLDNFSPADVRKAVDIIKDKALIEVSGGIREDNIKDYAIEGVDFISVGSYIPSSPWIDMSFELI